MYGKSVNSDLSRSDKSEFHRIHRRRNMLELYDAMIIGGGASGLVAACALGRGGRRVVLLEKQDRVGRKLLSTGNGRCNLTNLKAGAEN